MIHTDDDTHYVNSLLKTIRNMIPRDIFVIVHIFT